LEIWQWGKHRNQEAGIMKKHRNVQKISKDGLIQVVADTSGEKVATTENIFKAMENFILAALKKVDSNKGVSIQLFDGFYVDGTYVPERKQKSNLTGQIIDVASKIKIKTRITGKYTEKVNSQ